MLVKYEITDLLCRPLVRSTVGSTNGNVWNSIKDDLRDFFERDGEVTLDDDNAFGFEVLAIDGEPVAMVRSFQ